MRGPGACIEWRTLSGLAPYLETVGAMEARVDAILQGTAPEAIWLVEHPPLYTGGTSANAADLLTPDAFPVYQTGRGGQYTYHGPGQRVVYVMLDLKKRAAPAPPDLRAFIEQLETWILRSLAWFGVEGKIREGRVGVWVETHGLEDGAGLHAEAKIAAIGVRIRKWVSYHGIAINLSPELQHFSGIVPCGIRQHGVTSFRALGYDTTMAALDAALEETGREMWG